MQVAKNAFTLIELMVVVFVIAILYSLALPIMPKSMTWQNKLTLSQSLDKLESLRADSKTDAELSLRCKDVSECGFYDGEKIVGNSFLLSINNKNSIAKFESNIYGGIEKVASKDGNIISIKINKYGLFAPTVYFMDDTFFIIGGTQKISNAKTKSAAERIVFGLDILAFSDEQVSK
jgi:prepilin-type N-terminal cleavage/methylation domain-containing protein